MCEASIATWSPGSRISPSASRPAPKSFDVPLPMTVGGEPAGRPATAMLTGGADEGEGRPSDRRRLRRRRQRARDHRRAGSASASGSPLPRGGRDSGRPRREGIRRRHDLEVPSAIVDRRGGRSLGGSGSAWVSRLPPSRSTLVSPGGRRRGGSALAGWWSSGGWCFGRWTRPKASRSPTINMTEVVGRDWPGRSVVTTCTPRRRFENSAGVRPRPEMLMAGPTASSPTVQISMPMTEAEMAAASSENVVDPEAD